MFRCSRELEQINVPAIFVVEQFLIMGDFLDVFVVENEPLIFYFTNVDVMTARDKSVVVDESTQRVRARTHHQLVRNL